MILTNYVEKRKIDFYKLRQLCINEGYCTSANNEEYFNFLNNASKIENVEIDNIEEIAEWIIRKSNFDYDFMNGEIKKNIMFLILNNACTSFIEEERNYIEDINE